MADWECHNLTTLALDSAAFIDAMMQLVQRQENGSGASSTIVVQCTARWGATA
jgi:hypothetical protein